MNHFARSLSIYEELKNKRGIAAAIGNIGIIYKDQGNYAKAIDYYTRSLSIKEEMGDKRGIANSLNNIGIIYYEQGNYTSAIDYHIRSLAIMQEMGDKLGIGGSLNNIGNIYHDQRDYVGALDYYTRSLIINEEIGDKQGIANSLNNIGIVCQEQGESAYSAGNATISEEKYVRALDHYTRSLTIEKEIGNKQGIAASFINIGLIYRNQGDAAYQSGNTAISAEKYANAITYSTRGLTIAL